MARNKNRRVSSEVNRLIHYDELHFVPIEAKNERWAAEVLYFVKRSSQPFTDAVKYQEKVDKDKNIVDPNYYKKIIDPEEGKADFFSSDWTGNPIFVHLNKIVDARVERQRNNLVVKAADEFSKMNQQKENERMLGRNQFRNLLNDFFKQLGWPQLKKDEDPYAYVKRMTLKGEESKSQDVPTGMIDSIKSAVEDDEDMALFNEYVWKDGVEIAAEIGIKHYLNTVNKFIEHSEDLLRDIRLINKYIMRWYTSETSGLPILEYFNPKLVFLSKYKKKDMSDIFHWYVEYDVTYGDFVRMFGAKLTQEQLIDVFEKNKNFHGIEDFNNCSFIRRNNATIRIGYVEFESQDMEVYTDYEVRGNKVFKRESWDYQPSEYAQKTYKATRQERHYNVWRSCYYLPLIPEAQNAGTTDFNEQARYIYKLQKIQDQQRHGDDGRYSKSSLVTWSSDSPSWFDIMESYMPTINLLWMQMKNDLANAHPAGLVWVEEFLTAAIGGVDETDKDGKKIKANLVSMIKQTGSAIAKFKGKDNEVIAGGMPFVEVKTGHLNSAMERINAMMTMYQMMTRSLGMSETAEGVDPKARVGVGGLQLSMQGSDNATYSIEKAFTKALTQSGEWLLYYFKAIVDGGDSERLQDFIDVVGSANGMAMQSIKDIPMHKLGLYVENMITDDQKAELRNIASQMAAAGMLEPDIMMFLTQVDNVKYSYAILRLKVKQKQRQSQAAIQADREFQLQMKDDDRQFEMAKQQASDQAMFQMREMMKQWDARLIEVEAQFKTQSQSVIKDKITEGRIQEKITDKQLETA